ncbi:MAG: biotin/lipoyl-binding protein, partial [Bacteroidales bacterium]|nr:biotin/lipoyl-binding protein [Bacteroidales bacterium]
EVPAALGGKLVEINAKQGRHVNKGDVVAYIERPTEASISSSQTQSRQADHAVGLPALCYGCPVNLYERPQKRRVLGKRIEGVASDGMLWEKNPTPWKKVPTAACFYGAPPRRK